MTPRFTHALIGAWLLGTAALAGAQTLKAGQWDIQSTPSARSGLAANLLSQSQTLLAALPADKRQKLEALMASKGVALGAGGAITARVCLTETMVKQNQLPAMAGKCQHSSSPRSGNTVDFSFQCSQPPAMGQGRITIQSAEAYTFSSTINSTATGQLETVDMTGSGHFVAPGCTSTP